MPPTKHILAVRSDSGLGITVGISLISVGVFLFFTLMCVGYYRTSWTPGFVGTHRLTAQRRNRTPALAKTTVENLPIVRFEDWGGGRGGEIHEVGGEASVVSSRDGTLGSKTDNEIVPIGRSAVNTGKGERNCSICLEDFVESEEIRVLPCNHKFHPKCVDPWLQHVSGTCPVCRYNFPALEAENHESAV